MSQAFLQGGTSLVDFTDPAHPREIAYTDTEDAIGKDDTFTAYWYNGYIYANSKHQPPRNRPEPRPGGPRDHRPPPAETCSRYDPDPPQPVHPRI